MTINQAIRAARTLSGLSQADLAESIGVAGHDYVSRYESGERKAGAEVIEKISKATRTRITCAAGVWVVEKLKP